MIKKYSFSLAFLALVFFAVPSRAGSEYTTLHEVVRHFQVAFVERPNLSALLMGGLLGIEKRVKGCEISLDSDAGLYTVRAGSRTLEIDESAAKSYEGLEKALAGTARLVEGAKLAKNRKKLEHAIVRGMIEHCGDPWTVFIEAKMYERLLDDGTRKIGDVGMLVESSQSGLRVLDVIDGMPAHKAGIRIGMRVDSIAGHPASELGELEALALLRGTMGDKVEVVVGGKKRKLQRVEEPKRNMSVDPPVDGIARVHVLNFRAGTGRRLAGVMQKLNSMGMKGFILDLRGNPGGLVTEGTEVVGLFINAGKVVSVVSRDHLRTEVERSPRPGPYRDLPMVLLVDHRSASVSEIVAMALRDHDRAKIVGTKTLGKGTVQVLIELMDGSALKISNGRYYSPKGTPLFDGIEPDVVITWDYEGEDAQLKRAKMLLSR